MAGRHLRLGARLNPSLALKLHWCADVISRTRLTDFGEQRQLPRLRLTALVGKRSWILAREAVIRELRALRIAAIAAHGAVDAVDGKER